MATIKNQVRQVYLFAYEENGIEVIMCSKETPFVYLGAGGARSLEGARAQAQSYADYYGFPVRVIGFGQRRQAAEVFPHVPEAERRATPTPGGPVPTPGGNNAPVG